MEATYISNNSFSVVGLRTGDFSVGRRLKLDCGPDGVKYASVVSSEFITVTTVVINETSLTSNLTTVMYSPIKPGEAGNLPDHTHSNSEGDGGYIAEPTYEFTGLTDTPATYSGAEGLYAKVVSNQIVFAAGSDIQDFTDLHDTESTYSDTSYLYSTSSGIEYSKPILSGNNAPVNSTSDRTGMFYIDETNDVIYRKNRDINAYFTVKSIIIDIANNYGQNYMNVRRLEFHDENDTLIPLVPADFSASASSYHSNTSFRVNHMFDTTKSKTGDWSGTCWMSEDEGTAATNQRVIIVFDEEQKITRGVLNNGHTSGNANMMGIKDTKIYYSSQTISNTTYQSELSSMRILFDGTFREHVSSDVIDDISIPFEDTEADTGWDAIMFAQTVLSGDGPPIAASTDGLGTYYIDETNDEIYRKNRLVSYSSFQAKSVIFDIADDHNAGDSWGTGFRSIEFTDPDGVISVAEADITGYGSEYHSSYRVEYAFDTSLSKVGGDSGLAWVTTADPPLRMIVVFDEPITFTGMIINNYHSNGSSTDWGPKNTKIYATTDTYTNTTYNASISNSNLVFDGVISQHVASNVADDEVLTLEDFPTQDTGWDLIFESGGANFLGLDDTPNNYAVGKFLKASASGIEYTSNVDFDVNAYQCGFAVYDGTGGGDYTMTSDEKFRATDRYFDTDDAYNISNREYTVPVAGLWLFTWQAYSNDLTSSDGRPNFYHYRGASQIDRAIAGKYAQGQTFSVLFDCEVGDIVYMQCGIYTFSYYASKNHNRLSGVLVSSYTGAGSNFTTASGTPDFVTGSQTEDFYIDEENSDIYEKTATATFSKYTNAGALAYSRYLGSNNNGTAGATAYGSPINGGDYYTFTGSNSLSYAASVGEPYDLYIKFSISTLYNGTAQIIWQSGGTTNGYAVGLDSSGNLGVWGTSSSTQTSITISNTNLKQNVIYYLYVNYNDNKLYLYNDERLITTKTGTITAGDGTNWEAIGGITNISNLQSSVITLTSYDSGGTIEEGFNGDIYEIEMYPIGTFVNATIMDLMSNSNDWKKVLDGGAHTFLDLNDTPTTYSGGQYLRTTTSGIEAIDGVILKSPNKTEWLLGVTNSGTLTITEV